MDFYKSVEEIKTANPIRKLMLAEQLAVKLAEMVMDLSKRVEKLEGEKNAQS